MKPGEMKRSSSTAGRKEAIGEEKMEEERVVPLTSATIMLATIYNTAHRGKTPSVSTSVTEGQPDTNQALCFECFAPD